MIDDTLWKRIDFAKVGLPELEDDERIGLYFHIWAILNKNTVALNNVPIYLDHIQDTSLSYFFDKNFYTSGDPDKEWVNFVNQFYNRLIGKKLVLKNSALEDPLLRKFMSVHNEFFGSEPVTKSENGVLINIDPLIVGIFSNNNLTRMDPTTLPITQKYFTFRVNKFWLRRMAESVPVSSATNVNDISVLDDAVVNDKYVRDVANPNKLYAVDNKGNRVEVHKGSAKWESLQNDECVGLGLNKNNSKQLKCGDLLMQCLDPNASGNVVERCGEFMESLDFWNTAKKEVFDEMLPDVATTLLNRFGFEIVTRNGLRRYQEWDAWIEKLKGTNTNAVDGIAKNDKLKQYLSMVVNKVNSSPAILNPNYTTNVDVTNYLRDPMRNPNSRYSGFINSRVQVNNAREAVVRTGIVLQRYYRGLVPTLVLANGQGLVGGGLEGGMVLNLRQNVVNEKPKSGHALLRGLYNNIVKNLEVSGRRLHPEQENKINELFNQLKESEDKLWKAINITNNYSQLVRNLGGSVYDPERLLTFEHMNSLVEKRGAQLDKVVKRSGSLVDILASMTESLNNLEQKLNK